MFDKLDGRPVYRLGDGRVVQDPDRLYRRRDGLMEEPAPAACPAGHPLGPQQVLVGWLACTEIRHGGHRLHTCRACEATIYTPPVTDRCRHRTYEPPPTATAHRSGS